MITTLIGATVALAGAQWRTASLGHRLDAQSGPLAGSGG
jgi:hypothetical protein